MKSLMFICLSFSFIASFAQETQCRSKLKLNRDKTVKCVYFGVSKKGGPIVQTLGGNRLNATYYYDINYDTAHYNNSVLHKIEIVRVYDSSFVDSIIVPTKRPGLVQYKNESGDDLIDSLGAEQHWGRSNSFFDIYAWDGVLWTKNISRHSATYYYSKATEPDDYYGNRDSFQIQHHNGMIQERRWYSRSDGGNPNRTERFDSLGRLAAVITPDSSFIYENGRLLLTEKDTLIGDKYLVRIRNEYYPEGILKKAQYFQIYVSQHPGKEDTFSVLTWRYYNKAGVLVKTEKQKNGLIQIAIPAAVTVSEELPDKMFLSAEQEPEFAGGKSSLQKFISRQCTVAICNSASELKGAYTVCLK